MGWSFRRSIKMGPLRVNFSRSGVGLSAGIKGARISAGPRGTYVTFSAGGFQYRKKLQNSPPVPNAQPGPVPVTGPPPTTSTDPGQIYTASVAALQQSSPEEALQDIQVRTNRINWFAAYNTVAAVLFLAGTANLGSIALTLLAIGLIVPGVKVYSWNDERRTARLFYDVDDPEAMEHFARASASGEALAQTKAIWHVYSEMATRDWKRNAGAHSLIKRTAVSCINGPLPRIESNIQPWSIPAGPQKLLFLPDRLLVYENQRFAGIPYDQLLARAETTRFIEDGTVPADSHQVGATWKFVRKDGGPDRRFNNNRQLPILEYGVLTLSTTSGVNVVFHTSTRQAAELTVQALSALAELARKARLQTPMPAAVPVSNKSNQGTKVRSSKKHE